MECGVCGATGGGGHSRPRDRSQWVIPVVDLSEVITGRIVTPGGDFIVQWSRDEVSLSVFRDDGEVRIQPVAGNAVWITPRKP